MASVTASPTRTGEYTEPHRCRHCSRAFWGKKSWNGLTVMCPRCRGGN